MSDIEVVFTANPTGSKSLGYGTFKVAGISINYSVFSSPYNLGIMLNLPSHRSMKDGVAQMKDGKPHYINDVYIGDWALKTRIEEAVINAMYNKGVEVPPGIPYLKNGEARTASAPPTAFEQKVKEAITEQVPVKTVEKQLPEYDLDLPF